MYHKNLGGNTSTLNTLCGDPHCYLKVFSCKFQIFSMKLVFFLILNNLILIMYNVETFILQSISIIVKDK